MSTVDQLCSSTLTPAERDVWHAMHGANLAAYNVGCAARGTRPTGNPFRTPDGSADMAYWWNEGFHGREFAPITDRTALHHYALDHPTAQIPRARVDAGTASPACAH